MAILAVSNRMRRWQRREARGAEMDEAAAFSRWVLLEPPKNRLGMCCSQFFFLVGGGAASFCCSAVKPPRLDDIHGLLSRPVCQSRATASVVDQALPWLLRDCVCVKSSVWLRYRCRRGPRYVPEKSVPQIDDRGPINRDRRLLDSRSSDTTGLRVTMLAAADRGPHGRDIHPSSFGLVCTARLWGTSELGFAICLLDRLLDKLRGPLDSGDNIPGYVRSLEETGTGFIKSLVNEM